jgi:magnesium transporter
MTEITCRLYRDGVLKEMDFDPETVSDLLEQPDTMVWLDVALPTEETMAMLGREFGFHELALEDSVIPHQRPKIEAYDSYYFLVAYGVSWEDGQLVCHEMSAFISHKYLVTARKDPPFDLTPVLKRWDAHSDLAKEGAAFLLYILLDEIVDGYFNVLDALEERTEEIEEQIVDEDVDRRAQVDIIRLKRELLQFRRWAAPLREVLDGIQREEVELMGEKLEPYYRDVYDHVLRATDFIDNLRDILSTSFDAYLAVVNNRLGEVTKQISAYGAIILVPTLIAGIYGMNFRHMPELRWVTGYPFAIALMAGSALLLWRFFKRRGWL